MKSLLLCLSLIFISATIHGQDPFIGDLMIKWQNAKEYTLEFAEAMPADRYNFAPVPEEMTFGRQLIHMCGNMIWLCNSFLDAPSFGKDVDHPSEKKEDVIELLEESFDYAAKTLAAFPAKELDEKVTFFAGTMTKRRVMLLLADHVTHHRGQLVVYLRLNGIEPPQYLGW